MCFSAIFLEALGNVGYTLGRRCGWDAEAKDLELLEKLRTLNYDPNEQPSWRSLMMKESSKEAENGGPTYVFNNVRDSTQKVAAFLEKELRIDREDEADDAGAVEVGEMTAATL